MWFAYLGITLLLGFSFNVPVSSTTSFGCMNSMISDEWREYVLNFHNTNRKTVSEGNQLTLNGKMPVAKDMGKLNWDCNLERAASSYVCSRANPLPAYGVIKKTFTMGGKCDIKQKTKAILKEWWDEARHVDLSTSLKFDDTLMPNFGIMAFKDSTGFACTYEKCNSGAELLCVYDKKPTTQQSDLYTKGNAPTDICTACVPPDSCIGYLCSPPYTSTVVFPATKCNGHDDLMTRDMQDTAQHMHNYYRRLVATGWAPDKSGYAPTAKLMNSLEYDCDAIGEAVKVVIDPCTIPSDINYHTSNNLSASPEDVLKEGIKKWFEQLKQVDLSKTAEFDDAQTKVKQFAAMIYGDATKVGCSVKKCNKEGITIAACNYDQQASDPIYTVGNTCAGCTGGRKCESLLPGLCATP